MNAMDIAPCADCQKVLHRHSTLEYLYCGHRNVLVFRLGNSELQYLPVASTAHAIALVEEAGVQSELLAGSA